QQHTAVRVVQEETRSAVEAPEPTLGRLDPAVTGAAPRPQVLPQLVRQLTRRARRPGGRTRRLLHVPQRLLLVGCSAVLGLLRRGHPPPPTTTGPRSRGPRAARPVRRSPHPGLPPSPRCPCTA